MNDKQVRDLIQGQFMNEMTFRMMDEAKVARTTGLHPQKMPLFINIIFYGFIIFWVIVLGGTLLLSLLGLILGSLD